MSAHSARPATSGSPRVALIHATALAIDPINEAFARLWPQVERLNLLEDRLSQDRARDGCLTESMCGRFMALARYGLSAGAEAILYTCSAFGPAIEAVAAAVAVPVLKPNEAMFEQALAGGSRIGLVATFEPSLAPMRDELMAMARVRGQAIELRECHVPDAMQLLAQGDAQGHHDRVAQGVATLAGCDVVMLAQFSMAGAAVAARAQARCPVLTSPDCAVQALRAALGARTA